MKPNDLNRRSLMQILSMSMLGSSVLPRLAAGQVAPVKASTQHAVFIAEGSGRKGKIGANDIQFKLDKSQTNGLMGSAELVLYPGHIGAIPHLHHSFDEICRVLEGTVTILVGDEVVEVTAGGWHLRPRGTVHAFWNSGKVPAKSIEMYIPGGHEEFMNALADIFTKTSQPERAEIEALGKRFDTSFDWERLPQIIETYKVKL